MGLRIWVLHGTDLVLSIALDFSAIVKGNIT